MSRPWRIVVASILGLTACAILWLFSGKIGAENFLTVLLSGDWAKFDVPARPVRLDAEIFVEKGKVTVCNRSSAMWTNMLVRLTDSVPVGNREPLDSVYLAKVRAPNPSACVDIALGDFSSPGWKKIPAPPQMNIIRVEVLASVAGRRYAEQRFGLAPEGK
jgi:hypothetical protein